MLDQCKKGSFSGCLFYVHECMARIVPYNPVAFPPFMEVRFRRYEHMDV